MLGWILDNNVEFGSVVRGESCRGYVLWLELVDWSCQVAENGFEQLFPSKTPYCGSTNIQPEGT